MTTRHVEPIVFRWRGGEVALGYLGRFRWRLRQHDAIVEAPDARAAASLVLDRIFAGATAGHEAAEQAPIHVHVNDEVARLDVDPRMTNGWMYRDASYRGDVGQHATLLTFVTDLLARNAESAWARGVEPAGVPALGPELSFQAFVTAGERRDKLCERLAMLLEARLRESPSPATAFEAAMRELKALGHDLWRWDENIWGPDSVTRRPGGGLVVTRVVDADEDDDNASVTVSVELRGL